MSTSRQNLAARGVHLESQTTKELEAKLKTVEQELQQMQVDLERVKSYRSTNPLSAATAEPNAKHLQELKNFISDLKADSPAQIDEVSEYR